VSIPIPFFLPCFFTHHMLLLPRRVASLTKPMSLPGIFCVDACAPLTLTHSGIRSKNVPLHLTQRLEHAWASYEATRRHIGAYMVGLRTLTRSRDTHLPTSSSASVGVSLARVCVTYDI
jgi:hypothetical protein